MTDGDAKAVARLSSAAFNSPATAPSRGAPSPEGWVACANRQVVAAVKTHLTAQFFGGRPVPAAAISGVVVAPASRGKGVAVALLSEMHRHLEAAGVGVATLYPSAMAPYSRVGYGLAGAR